MNELFLAENIKCGGCVANIENGLAELAGVKNVEVELESGQVSVSGTDLDRGQISAKLKELGYPEK